MLIGNLMQFFVDTVLIFRFVLQGYLKASKHNRVTDQTAEKPNDTNVSMQEHERNKNKQREIRNC